MSRLAARKALLVVRAGDKSLHERWLQGQPADDRKFDLHISYFGDRTDPYPDRPTDVSLTTEKGMKFHGLDLCLAKIADRLPDYDYVGFPDDDLSASCSTWNRFVEILLEYRPALAQPALTLDSFYSHDMLLRRPKYKLRWTNFVEVMCPFFEREALGVAQKHFTENKSGWGLDMLWPSLLGAKDKGLCVVDETPVLHTRAVGSGPMYKHLSASQVTLPNDEKLNLMAKYGIEHEPDRVYSGITRDGEVVDGSAYPSRLLLMPRLRRKTRGILSINQIG